jgi:hypothetical protein
LALFGVAFVAGCQSGGQRASYTTDRSLKKTRAEVVDLRKSLDESVKALGPLFDAPTNLKVQLDYYSATLDRLDSAIAATRDRALDMDAKSQEYIAAWQKEAGTAPTTQAAQQAQARASSMQADFESIRMKVSKVREMGSPLVTRMDDVRRYLASDMTYGSIKFLDPEVKKIRTDAKAVDAAIGDVIAELDKVSAKLSPPKK